MPVLLFVLFVVNSLLIATSCSDYPIELCDSVGCEWVNTTRSTCLGPSASECSGKTTGATCEAVVGCDWNGTASRQCRRPDESTCFRSSACGAGCKQYGYCQPPPYSDCLKWSSRTSCEAAPDGCEWTFGRKWCQSQLSQKLNCRYLEKAVCQATANCSWFKAHSIDECRLQWVNLCTGFTTESSCRTSERGCYWSTEQSRCYEDSSRHYCAANDDNTACSSNSSQYCVWNNIASEYCVSDYSASCGEIGDKTDCDRAYGCEWEVLPDFCYPDAVDFHDCRRFTNNTACLAPCKWIDVLCDVDDSLYCVNNPSNDGCNSVISDPGCVWLGASTPSCILPDLDVKLPFSTCVANEANTACSAYSTLEGCVWKSELVGLCQDSVGPSRSKGSTSFIIIPWLIFLLAFVILF